MRQKSSFHSDLSKEQQLSVLLDAYYSGHLKNYDFERISDKKQQILGVDVNFIHNKTKRIYSIDEKAQLDYLNEDLPTFAFEISYQKSGVQKEGWLFDNSKITDFYSLITGIYADELSRFLFCKITLVNREKLVSLLKQKNITKEMLLEAVRASGLQHGKIIVDGLDQKNEGYLFYSKSNKAEQPINLILKLDWLLEMNLAKRLV